MTLRPPWIVELAKSIASVSGNDEGWGMWADLIAAHAPRFTQDDIAAIDEVSDFAFWGNQSQSVELSAADCQRAQEVARKVAMFVWGKP